MLFEIANPCIEHTDPMQLVDELSMIYTTCLMCYASFSYSRPNGFRVVLGIFLASLAIFITLYYHYLQDPLFHQNAYGILTAIVLIRSMYTMEVTLRPRVIRRRRTGLRVRSRACPFRLRNTNITKTYGTSRLSRQCGSWLSTV